jgi:hypothetical protein
MEIFGPDGVRRGVVELPSSSEIIGFGKTTDGADAAYVVRTDEVGLKWLECYRIGEG